jgi:hypothetical protein
VCVKLWFSTHRPSYFRGLWVFLPYDCGRRVGLSVTVFGFQNNQRWVSHHTSLVSVLVGKQHFKVSR